jgi:hypothetical protein
MLQEHNDSEAPQSGTVEDALGSETGLSVMQVQIKCFLGGT